jgi:cytochrome c oxidase accessory protein FixG
VYPRLSRGRFWVRRRSVAYLLMGLFMLLPFLQIGGRPAILLDVMHRRFYLFGLMFLPTDTFLLALFAVSTLLLIFFLTALLGRVWCGWACPQTVYMEFLFRPIERLFTGRRGAGGKPKEPVAGWRIAGMYATYILASVYVANTFLAYFVGVSQLRHWVTSSPASHPTAFLVMAITTALMLFNFAYFREQTCLIACPYGRFQSVLMDRASLIISYDRTRGEPRGPIRKVSLPVAPETGDCVDCEMCVTVCPTGIDIRNGLQFECVGCAQCIDACDQVMRRVNRPTGLIRYGSQAGMAGEPQQLLRPRVIVYPLIILLLGGLLAFLIATRSPTDVTILRGLGTPFITTESGEIENLLRVKITNRTDVPQHLTVSAIDPAGVRAIPTRTAIDLAPGEATVEPVRVLAPASLLNMGGGEVTLKIAGLGVDVQRSCQILGPMFTTPSKSPPEPGESHEEH